MQDKTALRKAYEGNTLPLRKIKRDERKARSNGHKDPEKPTRVTIRGRRAEAGRQVGRPKHRKGTGQFRGHG